ncbi:MAG: hypothetical protein WAZ14_01265 [Patescibacteria group bacterium]
MFQQIKALPALVRRSPLETFLIVALAAVLGYVLVLQSADIVTAEITEDHSVALSVAAMQNQTVPFGTLPQASLRGPFYTKVVTASAYNSVPEQTDDTPFTTASGTTVRHGVIAANFLPIGTLITIPDYYGDQIFVVEDRMNARYTNTIDIWMESVTDAKRFGRRAVKIHVYTGG